MASYPTDLLPKPNFDFSGSQSSAIVRSQMKAGNARQRRNSTSIENLATINFLFNKTEYLIFRSWFSDQINMGESWFTLPLKLGAIEKTFRIRFTGGYGWNHQPVNNWLVSAEIEFESLLDASYSEIVAAELYFFEDENERDTPTGELPEFRMVVEEINESFTLDSTHANKMIHLNSATDIEITLPASSGFDVDYFVVFSNFNLGAVRFILGTNAILYSTNDKRRIQSQYSAVMLHYKGNNQFHIYGDLRA
ncbi:hypothetical protein OAB00_01275 [Akkermansiaceae bacterium]|nr:hypothetical protein [Akkermansiaceae bacterium]